MSQSTRALPAMVMCLTMRMTPHTGRVARRVRVLTVM